MLKIKCAGGIVLNQQRKILVVTNRLGKRTLPKGTCEVNEIISDAALREVQEESGLTQLKLIRPLGIIIRKGYTANKTDVPSVIKNIHMFYITTDQLELGPYAPDIIDAQWISISEIAKTLTWPEEAAFCLKHWPSLS
jgi:ADP-ribose pyrophosphatase YjhB (NUDIX family)